MTRTTRFALSVLAALLLVGLVIGIPIGLALAAGWPFPNPWPTLTELGDMVAGRAPVPADLVISILALVMWLLWFQVAWAVVVEVAAALRGRLASRAPVLPGLQLTIGKLVTTATLLTTSLSARPVAAGPLLAVAPVAQIDDAGLAQSPSDRPDGSTASRSSGPSVRAYITEPGDTWWGIAEDVYGAGPRWKEIRNLNLGRTMDDGSVISVATDLLRPQWRLLLPAGAEAPVGADAAVPVTASTGAAPPSASTAAGSAAMDRPEVVVEAGDTVWGLAEEDLQAIGRDTTNVAVAERADEIAEINREQLDGDPDLIYPGQRLELPARPVLAERAPTAAPDPAPSGPDAPDGAASDGADAGDAGDDAAASDDGAGPDDASGEDGDDATPSAESASEPVELEPPSDEVEPAPEADPVPDTNADPEPVTSDDPVDGTEAPDVAAPDAPETMTPDPSVDNGQASTEELAGSPDQPPEPSDDADGSPLSPAGDVTETAAPSALAGARASSPDWIPSSTPDASESAFDATNRVETSVPASGARSLVAPSTEPPATTPTTWEPTAELPAVGSGEAIDVVVNGSPGADEALDTADGRAPIFAGLAAITLVGGYLFRAKARRRKTVLQSRHPGRRPEPSRRRTRTLTRRLAAAAEPGHPEFVNLGLRALGRLLSDLPAAELPRISGVWVSQNRLVLALSDDTPDRPPPAPFTQFADGSGWSLSLSSFDEIRAIARGANGPLPLLTTVGTTTALDLALTTNSRAPAEAYGLTSSLLFAVDLEAGRVISVEGRPPEVIEAMTMMVLELATSETADQAEIVCVGFGHRLDTFDRVMVVDDLSGIMADLAEVTNRAVYASGDASPFATRVRDGAADTWNPVIVFHADPDDPEAQELVELAERTDGGVTLVCGYPADSGWRFLVDGEGVNCPDLPGSLAGHRFSRPRPGEADDLIDLFDDEAAEIDLDDEFWRPLGDEEFGLDPGPVRSDAGPLPDDEPSSRAHALSAPGRSGGPAGPPLDVELPAINLRHSTELRTDNPVPSDEPAVPAPTETTTGSPSPTGAPDGPPIDAERYRDRIQFDQDVTGPPATPAPPASDDGLAPSPGGRHLYVVGDRATRPDQGAEDGQDGATGAARHRDADAPAEADDRDRGRDGDGAETDQGRSARVDAGRSDHAADPELDVELRVNVLGNFTIGGHHVGDRNKPWKYTKTSELILYLLLHPDGASQDLLMEQLFPEQPTNRPRLNQLVSDARTKALGLDSNGEYHLPHASPSDPFYRLTNSVAFDLRDFALHCARARRAESQQEQARQWTAALELVGGRPFTVPNDGYGWALPEIEATIVKVEEAAVALADIAMDLGDHRLAVWATKKGLLTGTGYYELLVRRGRAALLLEDPEEIVRAFADLQMSLDHGGAPEEGMPDLGGHPDLADIYNDLSDGGRGGRDRNP